MRRYGYILAFLLVLLAPLVVQRIVTGGLNTHAKAQASSLRLVVISPHNQDIRGEFAGAFKEWHAAKYGSPVELDFRTMGGTNDIQRFLDTNYSKIRTVNGGKLPAEDLINPPADIIWGGGDYFFDAKLKPMGVLQPLDLDPEVLRKAFPERLLAGVRLYDWTQDAKGKALPPQWVGVCLSSFGIVYNPDLYQTLDLAAPTTWQDLTDPRLSGLVALADPTHSGSAAVAYVMVMQRNMADAETALLTRNPDLKKLNKDTLAAQSEYQAAIAQGWKKGMGQLLLIAANSRYFTDSASVVPTDVANGEAAAGMAIDFYGRVTEEIAGSQRLRLVTPQAATAITPDPVGILRGVVGQKHELATHFIEFLLSKEGQLLWIVQAGRAGGPRLRSLHRLPIRHDLYPDQAGWSDTVNPFKEAGGFNQRAEWSAMQGDLTPLWGSAWIDNADALHAAYHKVLAVKDQKRRAQLLEKLADLPIAKEDMDAMKAQRRKIVDAKGDVEIWKTRQRIHWSEIFKEHYQSVEQKAAGAACETQMNSPISPSPVHRGSGEQ